MVLTLKIQQPGLLTTIQDQGRRDYFSSALSRGGAQDCDALEIANRLVGNSPTAAGLEITAMGPTIFFNQSVCICCHGAPITATVTLPDQSRTMLPLSRPVVVAAQSTVRFGNFIRGFRAWIAFSGGIESPVILGSRSSHLAAEIGPARLAANDVLELGPDAQRLTEMAMKRYGLNEKEPIRQTREQKKSGGLICTAPSWFISSTTLSRWPLLEIPVMAGRHFKYLSESQKEALLTQEWKIDPRSNRQGLALEGSALKTSEMPAIMSEPVRFGTVQLPPGGKPFVMMAEHQTTGGYPRVLEAVSAARSLLAQANTESCIKFVLVDSARAQELAEDRLKNLSRTRYSIEQFL